MKIIVANYRYFVAGGPEKYMFKFMDAAKERKIEIIPFSVSNPQNEPSKYNKYFAKPRTRELMYSDIKHSLRNYFGLARATIWNYEAASKLKKLIEDTKPDAIYILHEINHLSTSIIKVAHNKNIRVIHRISDFFMFCAKSDFLCGDEICEACLYGNYSKAIKNKCVKNSKLGTLLRIIAMKLYTQNRIFDKVDHYITTCNFTKNVLIRGGIAENKITCVPTFINTENIQPEYEHDKYFLFLGRMAHQKGTIYAIEAMNFLKTTDYVLKITGEITNSIEDQKIWNYIVKNKLQKKIVFTGFKHGEELDQLINRSTCVVCPAIWYENMPNTVIESYAHGKPVVASNIGSLAEIVKDGKTGFLFEPKSSKEMSEKLRLFIENPFLSKTLGLNSRKECEKEYSLDTHMDKILEIIKGKKNE